MFLTEIANIQKSGFLSFFPIYKNNSVFMKSDVFWSIFIRILGILQYGNLIYMFFCCQIAPAIIWNMGFIWYEMCVGRYIRPVHSCWWRLCRYGMVSPVYLAAADVGRWAIERLDWFGRWSSRTLVIAVGVWFTEFMKTCFGMEPFLIVSMSEERWWAGLSPSRCVGMFSK